MASPDFQPTLAGPTVVVRPLKADDWEGLFRAASDPLIWEQHSARDRHTQTAFRAFFDEALASGKAFAFIDKASGGIIGSSRYHGYDAARGEVEIGWTFLARKHWGGQTNAEVKRLMLDHAFTFVRTVVFYIGESNLRSRRAVEKIGGVLRGGRITRRHNGIDHPYVVYEISRTSPA